MISAVWLVRSHQIAADLRYWLTYIGYDRRDRSLAHKVYLVYATLFFSVWGFATLSLLANWAGGVLKMLAASMPGGSGLTEAAVSVLALALLGWWLFKTFKAGRASPLIFTEDDAALICQAPVSRPAVALLWLLGDWIKIGPIFWALAVTLAFALQDAALGAKVSVEFVPRYVLAGLRALTLTLFVQWGLMALAWAWGALRLERDRVRRGWWLGPVIVAAFLAGVLVNSGNLLGSLFAGWGGRLLLPLVFPVSAGYGLLDWSLGLLVALAWTGLGSVLLALAARNLNLGRAAQESTGRAAMEAAAQAGNAQAVADISLRSRLGVGHPPTRLPGRGATAWRSLIWKTALSWSRRGIMNLLGPILMIFATGLGVALAPDWGTRAWAAFAWLVAVEQFAAGPLVDDLRMWHLYRGLPFDARQSLMGELVVPVGAVTLLGWLALSVGGITSGLFALGSLPIWAALLVPGAALSCALAAALDVLRSSRSSRLLTGQAPMPGTTGSLIAGLALGLGVLAIQFGGGEIAGYFSGMLVLLGIGYLLLGMAAGTLSEIE
jgi:hypothetical protein